MLDDRTRRTRIIRAAFRLAESKGWRGLSLLEIAGEAKVSLADIHRDFSSKSGILRAFASEIDEAVLRQAEPDAEEPARDRLFEVLMTRFELLAPYRTALARIYQDFRLAPAEASRFTGLVLQSQYWMLNAAGIQMGPPYGPIRVPGLAAVYARVVPIWLQDDDAGLARTMAALDRELRRGERWLRRIEPVCGVLWRVSQGFRERMRSRRQGRPSQAGDKFAPHTGPGPTAAGMDFGGTSSANGSNAGGRKKSDGESPETRSED
jgi:AcrR family transcriptional regulator